MAEPTFTAEQVYSAVLAVLSQHPVSLWLDQPQDTTTPSGHLHPEDAGHVARWVLERLHASNTPDGDSDRNRSHAILPNLLAQHVDCSVVCDRFCSCGVQHPVGHAAHLAEVIAAEFLVVPHGEIEDIEYGYRHKLPSSGRWCSHQMANRDEAIAFARSYQPSSCQEAEAWERPVLQGTPIPLKGAPDGP